MKLDMKTRYLASLLAATSLALALPVQAHSGGPGQGGADGTRMFRHLNLTAEQRDQVSKIFQEQAPAFRSASTPTAPRTTRCARRRSTRRPTSARSPTRRARRTPTSPCCAPRRMRKVIPLLTPEQRARLEQAPTPGGHRGRR